MYSLPFFGMIPQNRRSGFIHFDSEVGVNVVGSNISQWTDKISGLAGTQATASLQPTREVLNSFPYVRVLNNNSKVLTFSIPANSGIITGRAYFGFGNSVFACNILIPNSTTPTNLEIGRYGDYLTGILIYKEFPSVGEELLIINELKAKINSSISKSIDNFFRNVSSSRITNRITEFSGNNVEATSAISAWQGCTNLTTFSNNNFPAATNLTSAWENCTNLTTFSNNNFPAATNLTSAWRSCINLTTFSNNNFPAATTLTSAWQSCINLTTFSRFNMPNITNVSSAWSSCKLTQGSVDNILISLAAGLANNPTKTGLLGTSALTGTLSAAPGTTVRTLTNSWENALSQVNETLDGTVYNFSNGITGQQAKAWLAAKKNWVVQTN